MRKISIFSGNLKKNSIFHGKFPKNIDFPGKNWLITAISGQIILFLFKSHHCRTFFLNMIRYINILRPVLDLTTPLRPPAQNLGGRDPQPPRIDAYAPCSLNFPNLCDNIVKIVKILVSEIRKCHQL